MNELPSEVTIETVIHTHADNVLSSLFSGSDGIFQRDSIVAEEGEAGREGRVVLWSFKLEKARKVVEWLLRMKVKKDGDVKRRAWKCRIRDRRVTERRRWGSGGCIGRW